MIVFHNSKRLEKPRYVYIQIHIYIYTIMYTYIYMYVYVHVCVLMFEYEIVCFVCFFPCSRSDETGDSN